MSKIPVDFSGIKSFVKVQEGQHVAKLIEITEGTTQNGDAKLSAKFKITKGNSEGGTVYENFILTQKALWKLKSFLDCIGVKADGKNRLDLKKLVGKIVIIDVLDSEFNGKVSSKIQAYKKITSVEATSDDEWDTDELPLD